MPKRIALIEFLDSDIDSAKTFLSKRDLWDHGFLGKSEGAQKSLGIGSVPHYCLVDADGTILEWGSDLDKVRQRLESLMEDWPIDRQLRSLAQPIVQHYFSVVSVIADQFFARTAMYARPTASL